MKKIYSIILTTSIFVIDMIYAYVVLFILRRLGIDITKFGTVWKYICLFLIYLSFMLLLFLIFRKSLIKEFKDYIKNFKQYFMFGLKYWAIGLSLMFLSNIVIYHFYPVGASNESLVQEALKTFPLYMCFSTIIYAPFTEEIIFRKSLKNVFTNNFMYIIFSGFLFGFAHTLTNIGNTMELLYIIPYGSVGAMFAYMYAKTNNIFVPMTFHFMHNSISVIFSLLLYSIGGSL